MDISNPDAPTWYGNVDTGGDAVDVAVVGDTLFVADESTGIDWFNIAGDNEPRPSSLDGDDWDGTPEDVILVSNGYIVATGDEGVVMRIFGGDILQVDTPGYAFGLTYDERGYV